LCLFLGHSIILSRHELAGTRLVLTLAAAGSCYIRMYINNLTPGTGTPIGTSSATTSIAAVVSPSLSGVHWLSVGDTVQMRIYQNSGFAATMHKDPWLGAAAIYAE
jgi:hypothetical protein